jgi:hypothetical protein
MKQYLAEMKWSFLFMLTLSILAGLFIYNATSQTTYVGKFNIFHLVFREAIETVFIEFDDGDCFCLTTNEGYRVSGDPARIADYLVREQGKQLSHIIRITHNHFSGEGFTWADKNTYFYFKNRGFNGKFQIYYTATGKTKTLLEE